MAATAIRIKTESGNIPAIRYCPIRVKILPQFGEKIRVLPVIILLNPSSMNETPIVAMKPGIPILVCKIPFNTPTAAQNKSPISMAAK